jgi:protein-tyrosine phosphatase
MSWILAVVIVVVVVGGALYLGLWLSREQRRRIRYPEPESLITQPETDIWVIRHDDDTLEIGWRLSDSPVRVYAGTQPETIDRAQPVAVAETGDHVRLTGLDPLRRYYFEVSFGQPVNHRVMTAERVLPLASVVNFRDIGGYRTRDGGYVRWGRVYRAGSLGQLSGDDESYLQHLGLKIVCDLRTHEEVNEEPDRLPGPDVTYLHEPIFAGDNARERLRALILQPRKLAGMMLEIYTHYILEFNAPFFGDLLRKMADDSNLPMVIHCTAGKDRTGVTIMLLLLLLDVPEDVIAADYSLSNRYFAHYRAVVQPVIKPVAWMGITVDDLTPLLTAHPDTIRATIAYLREHYGSVEGYLRQKAGLDAATLAAIRANLLA